jgi:transposase
VTRDWRDERIEELERENAALRARVCELEAIVEAQKRTIAELGARVRELEARLGQRSGNSSRPPSSDPPGSPPPALPKRTGRRRGGQPGHPKHDRPLVPPGKVTRTHVLKPQACECCGKALHGQDPEPDRHQVVEIPKAMADVDEYQIHTLTCDACGASTRAALPPGVPTGHFGPRLQAIVAVSSGAYKMSKREIEQMVEDFFGVPIACFAAS